MGRGLIEGRAPAMAAPFFVEVANMETAQLLQFAGVLCVGLFIGAGVVLMLVGWLWSQCWK